MDNQSYFDQLIDKAKTGKTGTVLNMSHKKWDFDKNGELLGKYIAVEPIRLAKKKEGQNQEFNVHIFEQIPTKENVSVAGAALDAVKLVTGNCYVIGKPETKQFKSSKDGETRNFKDYGITDVTGQVNEDIKKGILKF